MDFQNLLYSFIYSFSAPLRLLYKREIEHNPVYTSITFIDIKTYDNEHIYEELLLIHEINQHFYNHYFSKLTYMKNNIEKQITLTFIFITKKIILSNENFMKIVSDAKIGNTINVCKTIDNKFLSVLKKMLDENKITEMQNLVQYIVSSIFAKHILNSTKMFRYVFIRNRIINKDSLNDIFFETMLKKPETKNFSLKIVNLTTLNYEIKNLLLQKIKNRLIVISIVFEESFIYLIIVSKFNMRLAVERLIGTLYMDYENIEKLRNNIKNLEIGFNINFVFEFENFIKILSIILNCDEIMIIKNNEDMFKNIAELIMQYLEIYKDFLNSNCASDKLKTNYINLINYKDTMKDKSLFENIVEIKEAEVHGLLLTKGFNNIIKEYNNIEYRRIYIYRIV